MNDPCNLFVDQRQTATNKDKTNTKTDTAKTATNANATDNTGKPKGKNYNDMTVDERKKMLTDLASKYQKEGEGQLIKDILANVIDQKAKGQLSNEQLREFAKRVTPLLNQEQRARLTALLDQLLAL